MMKFATLTSAAVLLAACASTPDVTYYYHPAKSTTTLSFTQTIDCAADMQNLVVTSTPVTPATTYVADTSVTYSLPARSLDGAFADSDVTMTTSEDGRLKGVNAKLTGEGKAIVNAAMSLVGTALKAGGNASPAIPRAAHAAAAKPKTSDECAAVKNYGGGKPVTLTYFQAVDLNGKFVAANPSSGQASVYIALQESATDTELYGKLKARLPALGAQIDFSENIGSAASTCQKAADGTSVTTLDGGPAINLRDTLNAHIAYQVRQAPVAVSDIVAPGPRTYCVGLPRAAAFGNGTAALTLLDSGALTSVQLTTTNGSADALSATQTFVTTIVPQQGPAPSPPAPAPAATP